MDEDPPRYRRLILEIPPELRPPASFVDAEAARHFINHANQQWIELLEVMTNQLNDDYRAATGVLMRRVDDQRRYIEHRHKLDILMFQAIMVACVSGVVFTLGWELLG